MTHKKTSRDYKVLHQNQAMNTSIESVSGETPEIGTADEGKVEGTLRGVQGLRSIHVCECGIALDLQTRLPV